MTAIPIKKLAATIRAKHGPISKFYRRIRKLELERLVQEEILSGHFQNVDDLLMEAIEALREKHAVAKALNRDEPGCSLKNNLAQFLLDSPFAGSDLDLERQQDYN